MLCFNAHCTLFPNANISFNHFKQIFVVKLHCMIKTFPILYCDESHSNFEIVELKCNTKCVDISQDTFQFNNRNFTHKVENSITTVDINGIINYCSKMTSI